MVQLMTLLHGRQPHPIAIKWKSAVFDSIPSVHITIQIKIKFKVAIAIAIEIAIKIEIAISIQIIIEMATTTIQRIARLCRWTCPQCRLQFDTERWMLLSCKELSNPLLIRYAFIKLIHLICWSISIINHTI